MPQREVLGPVERSPDAVAAAPAVFAGKVSRVAGGSVFVNIPGYMPHRDHGPAPYIPRDTLTPVAGDKVWCVIDDQGEAVIVCWEPA